MFKHKKKKTGCITPEFRRPTPPPPPKSGSNVVKPPNTTSSIQPPKQQCSYETPCGWCTKWDKKCDKKIPERGLRAKGNFIEDAIDSSDAMNVINQAIDEIKLLDNIFETDKYSDSVYSGFRKEVCADCPCTECMQSKMDIVECPMFDNYLFDI